MPCIGKEFVASHLISFNTANKFPQILPLIVSFPKFNATLAFESSYMFYFPLPGNYLGFFLCVLSTVSQLIRFSLDNFCLSSWELVCCCPPILRPISRFCVWQLFFSLSDLLASHIWIFLSWLAGIKATSPHDWKGVARIGVLVLFLRSVHSANPS